MLSSNDFNSSLAFSLDQFKKHDLVKADSIDLMNRVDSKFLFRLSELPKILEECVSSYSALQMLKTCVFAYKNTYFDFPDYHLYLSHHNKKLNRNKVRFRTYPKTETKFLEVKTKTNKGRTVKARIKIPIENKVIGEENAIFIAEQGITNPKTLVPVQMCNYKRISLMDYGASERLTFDFHLHYNCRYENSNKRFDKEANFELGDFVIAELKQNKLSRESKFYEIMRKRMLRPKGFSKYCMGMFLCQGNNLKSNRFKSNLLRMRKEAIYNG